MHIIQDSCTIYVTEEIKEMFKSTISTILGVYTKYIQPFDAKVIINFKKKPKDIEYKIG